MFHKAITQLKLVALAISVVGIALYYNKSSALSFYYRVKYYSGPVPSSRGVRAAKHISQKNPFYDRHYAVLINMALPSSENHRLKVYDLRRLREVFSTRVMHGKRSGKRRAIFFSNQLGSNKTALGRYIIIGQYKGKFGNAYRLAGIDDSNSNALARSIVIHSSGYISTTRVERSNGCPAVSRAALNAMKPYLHEGTLVWIYQ